MREWESNDRRQRRRYVNDSNRTCPEFARPNPRFCHDYEDEKKPDPALSERIACAIKKMEAQVAPENRRNGVAASASSDGM